MINAEKSGWSVMQTIPVETRRLFDCRLRIKLINSSRLTGKQNVNSSPIPELQNGEIAWSELCGS